MTPSDRPPLPVPVPLADARELARLLADPAADADEVARTSEEVEALQRSVNDELTDYGLTECGAG